MLTMRTAIRDITEGVEMGSVPGLSCSLYGGVDFGEDYRKVTGRSAVGKIACVLPPPEYGVL